MDRLSPHLEGGSRWRTLLDTTETLEGVIALLEDAKATPKQVKGLASILGQVKDRIEALAAQIGPGQALR